MEIAPGIHRMLAPLGERFNAIYLFRGSTASLVVDTGLAADPEGTVAPYVASIGLDPAAVRYVINTHGDFDHTGGNGPMRRLFPGAILMCGEEDRSLVESVERMITDRYGACQEV